MANIKLVYGKTFVEVDIPPENLVTIASPKEYTGVKDIRLETKKALREIIKNRETPEVVKAGDRVAIIMDDWSRPTPCKDIVPVILDELVDSGVREKDVTVIVGKGTRPIAKEDLIRRKVGEEVYRRVGVIIHDCDDEKNMVYCGMTSYATPVWVNRIVMDASLKIGVGNIVPHLNFGFSGGGKILLPGVCSRDTIMRNHGLNLSPNAHLGNIDNNPVLEDAFEATKLAGLNIVLNTVQNNKGEVIKLFAGDVREAWREGVEFSKETFGFKVSEKADIVILTPGLTYDFEAVWAFKSLCCAEQIIKDNGTIIVLSECPNGLGTWKEFEMAMGMEPFEIAKKWFHGEFTDVIAIAAHEYVRINHAYNTVLITDGISERKAKGMGFGYAKNLDEALEKAFCQHGKDARVTILTHGAIMVPIVV